MNRLFVHPAVMSEFTLTYYMKLSETLSTENLLSTHMYANKLGVMRAPERKEFPMCLNI